LLIFQKERAALDCCNEDIIHLYPPLSTFVKGGAKYYQPLSTFGKGGL